MTEARATYAQRIAELADDPRFAPRRDDLSSLAAELDDQDANLDASWVGIDLVQAFDGFETVRLNHRHRAEGTLGLLATVAVFAPVAWTWLSFHDASRAYRDMLDDDVDQTGSTFLSWWATGFDGRLSGAHQLVPMSIVSVVLIGLAVLLISLHRMVGRRSERAEDDAAAMATAQLRECLVGAQRVLNAARSDDPKHFANVVRTSVRHLLKAHEATESGAHEIQVAARQMSDQLTPLLQSLSLATHNAAGAATSVEAAGISLVKVVETTDDRVRRAVGELGTLVGEHAGALTGQIERLTGTQSELASDVSDFARSTDHREQTLDQTLSAIRDAILSLEQTVTMTEAAMQGQRSELTLAHDAAERILRHLERLGAPAVSGV